MFWSKNEDPAIGNPAMLLIACQPVTPPPPGGELVIEYHVSGGLVPLEDAWLIFNGGRVVYRDMLAEREEDVP